METRRYASVLRFLAATALVLAFAWTRPAAAHGTGHGAGGFELPQADRVLEHGPVTMMYEAGLDEQAQELMKRAPAWWADLENKIGHDVDDQVTIQFVRHAGSIAEATDMPDWVGGVANGARGAIAISLHAPDGRVANLDGLLRHEMAHIIFHRALGGRRAPRWLNEGTADSVGAEIDLQRAQTLSEAVFGGGVPSLAAIEANFRGEPEQVTLAYAASRDFVRFLRYQDPTSNSFHYMLGQIRRGHSVEEAAVHAFGMSLAELEAQWRAGLGTRFLGQAMVSGGLPLLLLIPLVGAAYIRRRRRLARSWAAMEAREALAAQLPRPWGPAAVPVVRV